MLIIAFLFSIAAIIFRHAIDYAIIDYFRHADYAITLMLYKGFHATPPYAFLFATLIFSITSLPPC